MQRLQCYRGPELYRVGECSHRRKEPWWSRWCISHWHLQWLRKGCWLWGIHHFYQWYDGNSLASVWHYSACWPSSWTLLDAVDTTRSLLGSPQDGLTDYTNLKDIYCSGSTFILSNHWMFKCQAVHAQCLLSYQFSSSFLCRQQSSHYCTCISDVWMLLIYVCKWRSPKAYT
jgi:hypothetical protein